MRNGEEPVGSLSIADCGFQISDFKKEKTEDRGQRVDFGFRISVERRVGTAHRDGLFTKPSGIGRASLGNYLSRTLLGDSPKIRRK